MSKIPPKWLITYPPVYLSISIYVFEHSVLRTFCSLTCQGMACNHDENWALYCNELSSSARKS